MAEGALHVEDNMLQRAEPSREQKLQQLERLMQSRTFQASENLISLLNYLVRDSIENPDAQLKEYTIATEVLGRGTEFDPRTDSVVRVQAKRLRTKLQEYYQNEGKSDQILIDLPKGHYKVAFSHIGTESLPIIAPPGTQDSLSQAQVQSHPMGRGVTDWRNYLIAALLVLIAGAVLLGSEPRINRGRRCATVTKVARRLRTNTGHSNLPPGIEPKRQRTAALQNLAEVQSASNSRQRLGVRQSSAALACPVDAGDWSQHWCLDFGVFLELGTWSLDLLLNPFLFANRVQKALRELDQFLKSENIPNVQQLVGTLKF